MLQTCLYLLKIIKIMRVNILVGILLSIVLFVACEKDDPVAVNEQELITTAILSFRSQEDGSMSEFSFKDIDGPGGLEPIISSSSLAASSNYDVEINLLNEQSQPVINVLDEIRAEKEEHQFFFRSDLESVQFEYLDMDDNGFPIGVEFSLNTGAPGTGELVVVLKHQPQKFAEGVAEGIIDNAGGETELEIVFDLHIN